MSDKGERLCAHAADFVAQKNALLIGYDHFARLWDLRAGTEMWRSPVPEADAVNTVADLGGSLFAYSTMSCVLSINKYS